MDVELRSIFPFFQNLNCTIRTVQPNPVTSVEPHSSITTVNHRRDAQFAGNDSCMRKGSTNVGHDTGHSWRASKANPCTQHGAPALLAKSG